MICSVGILSSARQFINPSKALINVVQIYTKYLEIIINSPWYQNNPFLG
jgi:hypothetical protein